MTDGTDEIELKLAIDGAFSLPDLTDDAVVSEVRQDESQDLWATYWDTADLRLARHGVTLRRRTGEPGGPRWTLKLPLPADNPDAAEGNGILARREIEMKGRADRVPARAADLVTAYARTEPLIEIAQLRTRRQIWSLLGPDGHPVAVLDDDDVSVMEHGRRISRFRELELESHGMDDRNLQRIGGLLRSAGAVDAEPIPKVVRALGPAATAPADAIAPEIGPDQPAGAAVRAALTEAVERIVCATTPGCAWETPSRCTRRAWELAVCEVTFASSGRCSTLDGLPRSTRSFAAWRANSARSAISTCSSSGSPRWQWTCVP